MARRRANGEGTIVRRKDGRYHAAVYVLTPQGTRVRRFVYGRTRAEVDEKLTELKDKTRQGIPAVTTKMTLGKYLDYWIKEVAPTEIRPTTLAGYESSIRIHIVPALGTRKLDKLTAADVRRFLAMKSNETTRFGRPHSARSLQYLHAVLRSALSAAVREELVPRNVAKLVKAPTVEQPEIAPLTVVEAKRLLAVVEDHRLRALWIVLFTLGLRRGEVTGLRWKDVDLVTGTVWVRSQVQRVRVAEPTADGPKTELRQVPPKTRRARRKLVLPAITLQGLREHKERQQQERTDAGDAWRDTGLVFTTRKGTPVEPRTLNRMLAEGCRRAGISPTRLHDLRHTCATLLFAEGTDPRVIMEILGHSKIGVTMDIYANSRELHQTGVNPQVAMSGRHLLDLSRA